MFRKISSTILTKVVLIFGNVLETFKAKKIE